MKFAQLVIPLISCNKHDFSWEDRHSLLPIKGRCDPPISYEDGAGIWSLPDWSLPGREDPDTFRSLRKAWVQRILHLKLDKQLMVYFSQSEHSSPPFTDDVVQIFRKLLIEFSINMASNWIGQFEPINRCISWSSKPSVI